MRAIKFFFFPLPFYTSLNLSPASSRSSGKINRNKERALTFLFFICRLNSIFSIVIPPRKNDFWKIKSVGSHLNVIVLVFSFDKREREREKEKKKICNPGGLIFFFENTARFVGSIRGISIFCFVPSLCGVKRLSDIELLFRSRQTSAYK